MEGCVNRPILLPSLAPQGSPATRCQTEGTQSMLGLGAFLESAAGWMSGFMDLRRWKGLVNAF